MDYNPQFEQLSTEADQHRKDEAAHPEDSAWHYNDITSRGADDKRNCSIAALHDIGNLINEEPHAAK